MYTSNSNGNLAIDLPNKSNDVENKKAEEGDIHDASSSYQFTQS
jgi:hypothetical protein